MICFVVARGFEFTLKPVLRDPLAPRVSTLPYDEALAMPALANATYIFADVDRLNVSDLTRAAQLYRRLQEGGCRVLNDPAKVRKRFALLRGLYLAGLNPNNAHLADEGWSKVKFPVFIRVADAHDGPLSDLISDQAELERALEAAVMAGIPRSTIVIVEYAAEPVGPGIYRKSAVHRVNERLITTINWHSRDWRVKGDQGGLADEALYDEELSAVRENRYASQASEIFRFANIDYGRLDFGLVGGRLCVYEINTNPTIFAPGAHSFQQRMESSQLRWSRFLEALHAIDTEENSAIIDVRGLSSVSWDRASKLYPSLCVPRKQLSKEQMQRGNVKLALRYAEEIVTANPSGAGYARVATLLNKLGRTQQALAAAQKARQLSPQEGAHDVLLARILLQSGHFVEARDCLQEANVGAKANGISHLLLSETRLKLGDFRGAWRAMVRAAELTPTLARVPQDRRQAFLMKAMWRLARLRSRLEPRLSRSFLS
jgi:tetratricopeptide (TPR) repeat protein